MCGSGLARPVHRRVRADDRNYRAVAIWCPALGLRGKSAGEMRYAIIANGFSAAAATSLVGAPWHRQNLRRAVLYISSNAH